MKDATKSISIMLAAAVAMISLFAITGCGDEVAKAPGVQVTDAWMRPTPETQTTGAIYMKISSDKADRLVSVEVDKSFVERAELHETTGASAMENAGHDDDMMSEEDVSAHMKMMRKLDGLDIPAGGSVELKPGGYHVMLFGLEKPIVEADMIPVTLTFKSGAEVSVNATAVSK